MTFGDVWNAGLFGIWGSGISIWIYITGWALCAILSYLLGSLNFGCIISKYKFHDDIRQHGSGNAGATNVLRTYGKSAAVFTYLGDGLKAAVAVLLVGRMLGGFYGAYISGLFCVIGHMWPCFFGFKGGKGVATTSVMILCLNPIVFLILLIIFVLLVAMTKYVSLGSVMCMLIYPMVLYKISGGGFHIIIAIIVAALVIFKHRSNINRLREGTENKISLFKKKDKKSQKPALDTSDKEKK